MIRESWHDSKKIDPKPCNQSITDSFESISSLKKTSKQKKGAVKAKPMRIDRLKEIQNRDRVIH
tara:strand:+ start:227 stop:418 length:192 start_codon:yes stop_codon:yes gene_type:complete